MEGDKTLIVEFNKREGEIFPGGDGECKWAILVQLIPKQQRFISYDLSYSEDFFFRHCSIM